MIGLSKIFTDIKEGIKTPEEERHYHKVQEELNKKDSFQRRTDETESRVCQVRVRVRSGWG